MRVDANQWPTAKIVASVNNYLDTVAGYAIGADKRFQWDDTNHTKLPIGTTDLTATQANYSFLTDEQGNNIVTLTRIDIKDPNGVWRQLILVDQSDIVGFGLDSTLATPTLPMYYDKIADNIIRLYPAPAITEVLNSTSSVRVHTSWLLIPPRHQAFHRFCIADSLSQLHWMVQLRLGCLY
jgi:hypothetical protein